MTFDAIDSFWWPYLFIFLAGMLPTEVWRWLGVAFAGRLRDDSEWILLARAVANALVAGVIARLILFPSGALMEVPVWIRLASVGIALVIYFGFGRNLFLGVFSGAGSLMLLVWTIIGL
ncbi:AzlD domain-containing protein [Cohaesibacter gelatinilyticus]|uniref:Branched-chain amino acid transport protein (AzlD) n=1 Tax=Cohaesibacter gelatinilyticus TaxID=372072 RepID=A0A285NFL3_9HYPH|nr:AzlD domain-containing protein [Cohaesibacter gelatinilyticus]SNZ08249.1 Branched-chain amino acid transport protein (AzlD) [Cohaesibacter gelatinilyticus]HAT87649.1 AzlD domain-containing protein [Hyphomicrobiales bacterium]